MQSSLAILIFSSTLHAQWTPAGATSGPIRYDGGNVGIGVAPAATLHVNGNQAWTSPLAAADHKLWDIDFGGGNTWAFRAVNDALTAASTAMFVTRSGAVITGVSFPNGNVGVGTTTPQYKLDILTSSASDGLRVIGNAGAPANVFLAAAGAGSASARNWVLIANGTQWGSFEIKESLANGTDPRDGTTRLLIDNNGNVGIGTTTPVSTSKLTISNLATTSANGAAYTLGSYSMARDTVQAGVVNTGLVVGSVAESYLAGNGTEQNAYGIRADTGICCGSQGTVSNAYGLRSRVMNLGTAPSQITTGYGLYVDDVQAVNGYAIYSAGLDDANFLGGTLTIAPAGSTTTQTRLTVNGSINVTGNINAKYQDVAEWVSAEEHLAPGTVVTLDLDHENRVVASRVAYDTSVAGVVSAQPGIVLGEGGADKATVATTGRVKVRVDATKSPIKIGDLLVTSDTPGFAMKSEPMVLNGRSFHQPGTVIGKALQPLQSGTGEILVLLSLQ
jgi:hypothetical protein